MIDITKLLHHSKSGVVFALLLSLVVAFLIGCLYIANPPITEFDSSTNKSGPLTSQSLESHLEYARDQATKRNLAVTICASANGQRCSGEGHWDAGWIIFTDAKGNPGQFNIGDGLLFAYVAQQEQSVLAIDANYVRYLSDGEIELE